MKALGLSLITVGFLVGALVSVRTEANEIDWNWFLPLLVVGVVGVALARLAVRREARHEGSLQLNVQSLHDSLDGLVRNIRELDGQKESLHPYEFHSRIDDLFPQDLDRFVEARESIGHVFGLQAYADVMNEFAAGERYLNRVWSASVDCYIDDVREYLGRARHQFEEAQRKLRALGDPPRADRVP